MNKYKTLNNGIDNKKIPMINKNRQIVERTKGSGGNSSRMETDEEMRQRIQRETDNLNKKADQDE